jgi:hypothetical protein
VLVTIASIGATRAAPAGLAPPEAVA